jgi:hypothetical protein
VWQTFMSQFGIGDIPEPGHQICPQTPLASQVPGGPSGGAHGGVFAFDGEHNGAALAVPEGAATIATLRPTETNVAAANAATRALCMRPVHIVTVLTDPKIGVHATRIRRVGWRNY